MDFTRGVLILGHLPDALARASVLLRGRSDAVVVTANSMTAPALVSLSQTFRARGEVLVVLAAERTDVHPDALCNLGTVIETVS